MKSHNAQIYTIAVVIILMMTGMYLFIISGVLNTPTMSQSEVIVTDVASTTAQADPVATAQADAVATPQTSATAEIILQEINLSLTTNGTYATDTRPSSQRYFSWMIDESGYSYGYESKVALILKTDAPIISPAYSQHTDAITTITEVFERSGYVKNTTNSRYEPVIAYRVGFEGGSTKCLVVAVDFYTTPHKQEFWNNDEYSGYELTIDCSETPSLPIATQERILDALALKNTSGYIAQAVQEGEYYLVSVGNDGPGGFVAYLKDERSTMRVLLRTQEQLSCQFIEREQIPRTLHFDYQEPTCYDEVTQTERPY